jgi:quercetin dioxygenase-like cupin family protein
MSAAPSDTGTAAAGSAVGAEAPGAMSHLEDLAALVAIADEATVSRTVLKAEGARVVMFSFDTGQELTEHTAAMPVLLQVLGGRLSVTAAGDTVQIGPGGLIHLTARLPHSVLALEPTQLVLTMLDPRVT